MSGGKSRYVGTCSTLPAIFLAITYTYGTGFPAKFPDALRGKNFCHFLEESGLRVEAVDFLVTVFVLGQIT